MLFRTVGRFSGTEDAGKTASLIKDKVVDVYEIKMKYRPEEIKEKSDINEVIYSAKNNYSYPGRSDKTSLFHTGISDISENEYSRECELSVLSKIGDGQKVRQIMLNNGAFDIIIYNEDPKII